MAETEQTPETLADTEVKESSIQDMEIIEPQADDAAVDNASGTGGLKRSRDEADEDGENNEEVKKLKADDKSVEEERLEKAAEVEPKSCSEQEPGLEPQSGSKTELKSGPIKLGPKSFESSVEMFDYFYKFLHFWTPNVNVNKYEHVMLLELLKTGHLEPEKKIGNGIRAFQVRYHPKFKSRCFFLAREDDSEDDFSFRKCVDHILPLPENMQVKHDVNKVLGGGRGGKAGGSGRGGRGHHRGRGGRSRN